MRLIIVFWVLLVFKQADVTPQRDVYGNVQSNIVEAKTSNCEVEMKYLVFTSTQEAQNFIVGLPVNVKSVEVYEMKTCNEIKR